MKVPSIEDVARVSLPNRGARGVIAMLELYMDDSGTHDGSLIVVWGGVAGDKHYMDKLDAAWREQLKHPCDGKPAIKRFHSYDLEHGLREFEGYNQGERDLTRRNFRQVCVQSDVTVLAYGVSVRDWDQLVRIGDRKPDYTAEQFVFGKAIFDVAKAAKAEREPLTLQFDQGRDDPGLRRLIQPVLERAKMDGRFVSYGFAPVAEVPALQAADLVVHEAYRVFKEYLDDPSSEPRAHAKRLFEDVFSGGAHWAGRREIKRTVDKARRVRKHRAKKNRS